MGGLLDDAGCGDESAEGSAGMSSIDISAIVATVGAISALLAIALFLRGIRRGKAHQPQDVKISRWPRLDCKGVSEGKSVPHRVMFGDANDPQWSKEALWGSLISHHLIDKVDEQCTQRIAKSQAESQEKGTYDARG